MYGLHTNKSIKIQSFFLFKKIIYHLKELLGN